MLGDRRSQGRRPDGAIGACGRRSGGAMQAACEAGEVFQLLEGGCGGARAAAEALAALFHGVREPWLARALLLYHARTGSQRALELLARAPEPHARHLLDALHDQLRAEPGARHGALAALAPLVARRPAWLRLLPAHPAARELLRAARTERDARAALHALLALAALVPAAPALAAAHAPELAEAAARAAAGGAAGLLAARALYRAVYATHPCTALEALRGAGAGAPAVAALVAGLRLHPALVTGSRAQEAEPARWARSEPHDVLAECRRLSRAPEDAPADAEREPPPPLVWRHSPAPPPGSTAQMARACGALRPGGEGWFALGERSGAEAAPHTPLPADGPAEAEPEPAVEATPENTPRLAFRFPAAGEPSAARALAGTPPGRAPDAVAAKLARVAADRRAADSPVPIGGAPPPAAPRPEPRAPAAAAAADADEEDREVRELTARGPPPPDWPDAEPPAPALPDPRRLHAPRALARPAGAAARRGLSAPGGARARRADACAQTVDAWPEPYEFLLADCCPEPPPHQSADSSEPCERLDAYLAELYAGRGGARAAAGGAGELAEQLALAHAQLMYERWRREAHAERNRRLLGRCRHVRALELQAAALRDRVRALARERDALRAAPPAPPAPAPAPAAREAALEAALRDERAARLRAEAARREAESARAAGAAELQRSRADAFDAARHVEALARAALAAERRAEHVRRLRRELLLLAEREARLREASAAPPPPAPPAAEAERAARAACAAAQLEADAAGARAEAAAARAHELEAALAARDLAVAELKRSARAQQEEAAARLRAARDKYAALMCVVRAGEVRALERLAEAPAPPAPPAGPR